MGKYQYMNLEQKLAKIRKKMPLLLKKYHNDEADYDFATLDDIYEILTPALNKYGVNFDIVKEMPTLYSENELVYLTLDKDDFWRYEADLELCWTNIDNPSEMNRAVIHIVGTHEIPDKAHGTALTYGLKYYFRNKFCMRQLGSVQEDPDGMEYGTEESGTGTERNLSSQNPNKKGIEPEIPDTKNKDGKETETAAKSGENRVSGNACTGSKGVLESEEYGKSTKPESNAQKMKEEKRSEKDNISDKESAQGTGNPKTPVKNQEQKTKEPQRETEKAERQQTEAAEPLEEAGDGFHTADEEEVPFSDSSFLDELEQEMEEKTENAESGLEAAKNYKCTFGLYDGKTLGDMMNSGLKGKESVKWIANRYKGPDKGMVEAAKLLLENQDLVVEQQAA